MKKTLILLSLVLVASNSWAIEGGYKDGLYIQSDDGNYSLKTNFHLQFQHQFLDVDGPGKTNTFQIRRGRVQFSGNAISQDLTYQFLLRMTDGATNNVSPAVAYTGPGLLDGYVNYKFAEFFQVKAGQFKVPFNLEELISDTTQQFIDRSVANEAFSYSRDLGVTVHGKLLQKKFHYFLYVMNEGNNLNTANKNSFFLWGTRLVFNLLGDHGLTSSDPGNSEEPQWMVGAAGTYNKAGQPTAADMNLFAATADTAFRYRGFSTIGTGYYFRNGSTSTNIYGFSGQAGYFILPEKLEMTGRFAGVFPTGGATKGYETGGGVGYYFKGHNLKILTDYAVLINSPLTLGIAGAAGKGTAGNVITTGAAPGFNQGQIDHRVRTQFQLFF